MRGYLIHDHVDPTSEGFGSHSRGLLFPLLHIALENDLTPILPSYTDNTARDYSDLQVEEFLGLSTSGILDKDSKEITINGWSDPNIGSACGDARLLASLIHDFLESKKAVESFTIHIVGALRYMNPSTNVWKWLQSRSVSWTPKLCGTREIHICAHVRVPEDFCPQTWKDENHVSKLRASLEALEHSRTISPGRYSLDVYTEQRFSNEDEQLLKTRFPNAIVHRGTQDSLLGDVKQLATADIFIPSSSHLSAFVGYLSHGLIVLSDESRMDYFHPHRELGNHFYRQARGTEERFFRDQSQLGMIA
jgi:hypothetical protein